MLTRIEVEGFRSLRHVELDLPGLTVLIGPNGSGKSNLLDVFALMAGAAIGQLSEGFAQRGGSDNLHFKGDSVRLRLNFDFTILESFHDKEVPAYYKIQLAGERPRVVLELLAESPIPSEVTGETTPYLMYRRGPSQAQFRNVTSGKTETKQISSSSELAIFQVKDQTAYPVPYKLMHQFESWTLYRPISTDPDAPIRRPQTVRSGMRLFPDGSNLASVLHAIQNQHPVVWDEMCEIIASVYADFHHLSFPPEGGDGKILLRWWEHPYEKKFGFSANLLSDGMLRLLCWLAILKTPDPPPLICIDEPEVGLHPDWIRLVAELLESAATRTQVIVSTHSPQLVSHVKPEHVVVVEKENGETSLSRLTEDELAKRQLPSKAPETCMGST